MEYCSKEWKALAARLLEQLAGEGLSVGESQHMLDYAKQEITSASVQQPLLETLKQLENMH